jgi:hypothetical protein
MRNLAPDCKIIQQRYVWTRVLSHRSHNLFISPVKFVGARGGAVGWGTELQVGKSRIRFPMVSLESFRPDYGPGVDSASNRNEYQEYFLWRKGGRCVRLTTLPPSCADCLEIWEPQPPGTLWACRSLQWDCLPLSLPLPSCAIYRFNATVSACVWWRVIYIYSDTSVNEWPC